MLDSEMEKLGVVELEFAQRTVIARWDRDYGATRFFRSREFSRNLEIPATTAYAFAFFALFDEYV